jgi:DNA-binding transcriptional regulator LsrR (DeoR family)
MDGPTEGSILKLGDHRQHVEQQPPDRVSRVMDRAADAELDLPPCQVFEDLARIWQRPREAIELRDDQRVAAAALRERLAQTGTLAIGPGQAVIDVRSALTPSPANASRCAVRS